MKLKSGATIATNSTGEILYYPPPRLWVLASLVARAFLAPWKRR